MKQQDFQNLVKGDKVVFTDSMGMLSAIADYPAVGTVLVRKPDWMDDGVNNMFTWADGAQWHYFYAEYVEIYKEQE